MPSCAGPWSASCRPARRADCCGGRLVALLSVAEVRRRSADYLARRGSPSARLDADLLLAHALGVDRLRLYTDGDRPLRPSELARARALVARRGRREPVAYLLGERAFRRLRLRVTPDVLVPRPE